MSSCEEQDFSVDVISDRVHVRQSRKGYRFGLDALLLATGLPVSEEAEELTVWELGAGQGAVSLSIAARQPSWRVYALERQPTLLAHLRHNRELNERICANLTVCAGDVREPGKATRAHVADVVVCNPPYFGARTRRASKNMERACAHVELHGGLSDFLDASRYVLKHRGWLKMILPPHRLQDLFASLSGGDLKLLSLRSVHAEPGREAYLVECVMRRGGGPDLRLESPLRVRAADGMYTREVAQRVAGAARRGVDAASVEQVRERSEEGS